PLDEHLLHSKIAALVRKRRPVNENKTILINQLAKPEKDAEKLRCIDLDKLTYRTKANPILMQEMIALYLEQTPSLVSAMKKGYESKNWKLLYKAVHTLIPSFSIMGINSDFENAAKKVQDFASAQQDSDSISKFVKQLESVCEQACEELKSELTNIQQ
ncbi:MAG: hybrid sensor histidine kinase/response regulator, partial [Bacteroidetes bacterium]|nr:hybrid sensor histidine kinase/response regulator [Bacteroidota bacterium]